MRRSLIILVGMAAAVLPVSGAGAQSQDSQGTEEQQDDPLERAKELQKIVLKEVKLRPDQVTTVRITFDKYLDELKTLIEEQKIAQAENREEIRKLERDIERAKRSGRTQDLPMLHYEMNALTPNTKPMTTWFDSLYADIEKLLDEEQRDTFWELTEKWKMDGRNSMDPYKDPREVLRVIRQVDLPQEKKRIITRIANKGLYEIAKAPREERNDIADQVNRDMIAELNSRQRDEYEALLADDKENRRNSSLEIRRRRREEMKKKESERREEQKDKEESKRAVD